MEKIKCASCGKEVTKNEAVIYFKNGETILLFCRSCTELFGTCHMCQHTYCGFFSDPDPLPQFVTVARRIQKGNITIAEQRQVPNPERIQKFCIESKCKCLINTDELKLCCRHGGCATCTNYTEKEQFNFGYNFPVLEADEN